MDQGGTGQGDQQRLTVDQAAQVLGLSVDAIRSKVKRNSIPHTRESGRVYILLSVDQATTSHDQAADQGAGGPQPESGTLTSELRDRLRYVEGQLEAERQAHAEARRIIAGLVERIPALEAPPEAPQSPEQAEQGGDRGNAPQQPETATSRPWWRRVFGG